MSGCGFLPLSGAPLLTQPTPPRLRRAGLGHSLENVPKGS